MVRVLDGQEAQRLTRPLYPRKHLPEIRDLAWHALPVDRVRHVGEPVAAVLAENRYQAEDALEAIAVEYEPLPVVADAEQALAEDAPLLFPEWESNELHHATYANGALDAAFAQADLVLRERFAHHRCTGVLLEPRGCLVEWDAAVQTLTIWSSSQIPQVLRLVVAEALGLDPARVRAVIPEVGGAFGNKQFATREEIVAAVLARETGRPVQVDRGSAGEPDRQRPRAGAAPRAGGRRSGRWNAARAACPHPVRRGQPGALHHRAGAGRGGGAVPPGPLRLAGLWLRAALPGHEQVPHGGLPRLRPPAGYLQPRASAGPIARALDLDPAEVRRRNLVASFPYRAIMGALYDSGDYRQALEVALAAVDYAAFRAEQARARAAGRLIGLGMACFVEGLGRPTGLRGCAG